MIVFAAHVPNSPLLLPPVAGDRIGAVAKTRDALEELAGELYAAKPDTILLLSDHPTQYDDAFSISVSDPYRCDLSDVGYLGYQKTYHPDFPLIDALQRALRQAGEPVSLSTDDRLHFSAAVPLEFLTEKLPHIRIVPISPSGLDPKAHFAFGQALKPTLVESRKRIAVISAGDLAHTLTDFAPGGFHEDGIRYDETLLTALEHHNAVGLMHMDESLRRHAQESAYQKLLILLGVLEGTAMTPSIMSYEHPFGVGYAVVHFMMD
ncbi:hypothetical protein HYS28_01605 [Candidatus Uhrbacteria bacterium]|nr:hypothetical protein [Candidatus Uhrbacteria bacterium]